jgi:spore germination protein YaaH
MQKQILPLLLFIFPFYQLIAQDTKIKSTHQEHAEYYKSLGLSDDKAWDEYHQHPGKLNVNRQSCTPEKYVFGWHPYWMGSAYQNYDWNLLTDLSYFSYEVNPSNGEAYTTHNWLTAPAVTEAQDNGVRVNLCVTLFNNHATFFNNATARQTLISNLISLVQQRNANGVNIDFENMASAVSQDYTNFMIDLCNQMHTAIPGSQVSIALHAVDWSGFYDIQSLKDYVDLFIIMGYDYYWSGSTTAGPNDPLYHFGSTYNFTLSRSITYYQDRGAPIDKLLLGLPYYGREYTTQNSSVPSDVLNPPNSASRTYKVVRDNTSGNYSLANKNWEQESFTPYYVFNEGGEWKQCFVNDLYSLGKRYDMVNQRGLAGIGIWALGYDDGYQDYWDLIQEKFTDCAVFPCTDTLYDMGGPYKHYYNDEDWTFTIQPDDATSVSLEFESFSLGSGDVLHLYAGTGTNAPLLGSYTGNNSPGTVSSSNGAITVRFVSDASGTGLGFKAIWTCEQHTDNVPPTTVIDVSSDWKTEDFSVNFIDEDDDSGVDKRFYQVSDFDGSHWYATTNRGFLRDEFESNSSLWNSFSGTWNFSANILSQQDESLGNTNLYAPLNQNLSNRYLYHWRGRFSGTDANRRGGLHFFADDPEAENRGNSYFAWFRINDNKIQIYKVVNDVFSLERDVSFQLNANQWYDFKVAYDRVDGLIQVYVNDELAADWTDSNPYFNGDYISFRSGNCIMDVDHINIYRTRPTNVTVTVGDSDSDIRFENPNPDTPAGRIRSIVQDHAANLSEIAETYIDIDWTPPLPISHVNDGVDLDIDTTYVTDELAANWAETEDPNSGVAYYSFAIGTEGGADDVFPWTNHAENTAINIDNLELTIGTTYYFSVTATNHAGLTTEIFSSDGQVVWEEEEEEEDPTSINSFQDSEFVVYPSPFTNEFNIEHANLDISKSTVRIYDLNGRLVKSQLTIEQNRIQVVMNNEKTGFYILEIVHQDRPYRFQLLKINHQ